jgi:hypothetical protein
VFDFVQGITAFARGKAHQDTRLELEGKAKRLLAVVKRLRHQAPDDIPAFVEGIRQYWMPVRYKWAT